jgi:transitional endoplasmic reticulum ATPase
LLLYGPSGCGKTMIAEGLAHECHCNFVAVKLQDLFSPFLGESEAFLRRLFRTARKATPCMLFLDDLDTMAAKRDLSGADGGGSGGVGGRILATLLNEMDGIESNDGVVVVAATNRRDAVDPALLRPGRLDVIVEVGMPTAEDREAILRVHTRRMPLGAGLDLAAVAGDLRVAGRRGEGGGMTGAGLKQVCQAAAFAAMRECDEPEEVGRAHFEAALKTTGW